MKIDQSILSSRMEAVRRELDEQGLEALVLYAMGSAVGPGSRTHGHMRYLCDWDSHHVPSVLILRTAAAPVLLVPNIFLTFLAEQYFWIKDVRFIKLPDFAREIASVLNQGGREKDRVGLVGRDEMPAPVWEGLNTELLDVEWVDCTAFLNQQRVVKDAMQLGLHRRAAEICDDMFLTLAREIRTPKPAFHLQADMEHTARVAGCEYCMTWLTVMPVADYSRFFRPECERVPQPGDQVFAGIYLIYEGHWGHAIRGGTVGSPSEEQREVFNIALEMEEAMLDRLRPGEDLYRVQAAAEEVLHKHYPRSDEMNIFRFRHGHGLGLSYEDPISSAPFPQLYDRQVFQNQPPMETRSGMLFELHPNLFIPKFAGAAIGDMVAITAEGPRILTDFPRELIQW